MIKNKIIITIILALAIAITIPTAFAVTTTNTLYACTPPEGVLNLISIVNLTNGKYISNVTMTVAGLTLKGCNGMAVDPTTGTFYAIVTHTANTADRHLVSFDPDTGVGTDIGALGQRMATLGFLADGSLRTVTGINTPSPEDYYAIDKTNAQTTLLCPQPATPQDEGQTLTLNYDDNKIYHLSGRTSVTNQLSTIDIESPSPTNCGITNLGQTQGHSFGESMSLAYNTDDGFFYGYGFDSFYTMNTTGFATLIQNAPNPFLGSPLRIQEMKGMAFSIILVDTTDPVISTTVSEPIPITKDSIFDEFEFMSCIDDTDGDISNTMVTVGSVDTSTPRTYFIDYTCTDVATNQSTLQVAYIVKRSPTGSGGITTTTPTVGGVSTAPTATTTPPLSLVPSEPTQPPRRTLDDIFDLFASLFEERVVPEPTPEIPASTPIPPPTEVRPSFIESIQNFFARLFR